MLFVVNCSLCCACCVCFVYCVLLVVCGLSFVICRLCSLLVARCWSWVVAVVVCML